MEGRPAGEPHRAAALDPFERAHYYYPGGVLAHSGTAARAIMKCTLLAESWSVVDGARMFAYVPARAQASRCPPVVLVHGLGVSNRYMVPLAWELARQSFPVYAPDLPGSGRSEHPSHALGVDALAARLRDWMRAMGIDSAVLVGHSLGCQVIVEVAAIAPEMISGAVLVGPTMDARAGALRHAGRLALDAFRETPALVLIAAVDYLRAGPFRVITTFRDALRHDMLHRVGLLRSPTVIARGERDPIAPADWVRELASRMSDATVRTIPNAAHAANFDSPGEVAALVGEVVRRLT